MSKLTIRLPRGVTEEEILAVIERYLELRLRGFKALDKLLSEKGLNEDSLKDFEGFREDYWEEKGRKEYGLS